MFCTQCGHKNPQGSRFCTQCGFMLASELASTVVVAPPADFASEDTNPYETPHANVEPVEKEIPQNILSKIKGGWIAGIISATVTLIVTLVTLSGNDIWDGLWGVEALFDVAFILIMTFGIYKKSRTAATLMLVYFVASKIYIWVETGAPSGFVLAMVFTYFYFQAMIGTFQYHKFVKNN